MTAPSDWRRPADLFSAAPVIGTRTAPAVLAVSLALAGPAGAGEDALEGMAGPSGERLRDDAKGLTLTLPEPAGKLQIGGRLRRSCVSPCPMPGASSAECAGPRTADSNAGCDYNTDRNANGHTESNGNLTLGRRND